MDLLTRNSTRFHSALNLQLVMITYLFIFFFIKFGRNLIFFIAKDNYSCHTQYFFFDNKRKVAANPDPLLGPKLAATRPNQQTGQ
jgi:hypothetical protein